MNILIIETKNNFKKENRRKQNRIEGIEGFLQFQLRTGWYNEIVSIPNFDLKFELCLEEPAWIDIIIKKMG